MSLQLILGRSGAGKSTWLKKHICKEAADHAQTNYLVIVPEQFTMQTQRDYVLQSENDCILNIDVLSFMRLAYRVFGEFKSNDHPILEDAGKMMLLRRIAREHENELPILASQMKKPGFLDEVKSLLTEFYQYGMTQQKWDQLVEECGYRPALSHKLEEIGHLFDLFAEKINGRYQVAEEMMTVLADLLPHSKLIRNSVISFDGFTGFTPTQLQVVEKLVGSCEVYITVCMQKDKKLIEECNKDDPSPGRYNEEDLFYFSQKTIIQLLKVVRKASADVNTIWLPENADSKTKLPRFVDSSMLARLEKNLFWSFPERNEGENDDRKGQETDCSIASTQSQSVQLYRIATPRKETQFAVAKIKELVEKYGLRYWDIAVVTGDLEGYGPLLREELVRADIPFFLDQKAPILQNPCVDYILSWIGVWEQDFTLEAVMKLLKNQNSFLKIEECDLLENYAMAVGLRGKSGWLKPYKRQRRREPKDDLERMNQIGSHLMEHLKLELPKRATVYEYAIQLHTFMVQEQLYQKLMERKEYFEEKNEQLLAREYAQVYDTLLHVLDQMVEILKDEQVSIQEFREILVDGLSKVETGLLPPGLDCVVVGDIERTRLTDIKALLFLGVNDGIVPKSNTGGGLLSDLERELLLSMDADLAPSKRQRMFEAQYYLYLNLTKPSKMLYLSFSEVDLDGKKLEPSYLIGKILRLYSEMEIKTWSGKDAALTLDGGKAYVLDGIREYLEKGRGELRSWKGQETEEKADAERFVEEADKEADKEADEEADKEADKEADEEADKEVDKEADREADKEADKAADEKADKEADKQTDKEADEEADREVDKEAEKETDKEKISLVKMDRIFEIYEEEKWKALLADWMKNMDFYIMLNQIRSFYLWDGTFGLSRKVAKELYGDVLTSSITRLERFACCACSHFLMYGLRLNERQQFEITLPDIGTIFHKSMEVFSKRMKEQNLSWKIIEEQARTSLAEEAVRTALSEFQFSVMRDSSRVAYLEKRVTRLIKRTTWAICEQVKQGEFEPDSFEVAFELKSGIRLNGKIDRIDATVMSEEDQEEKLIRVIDYKSGQRQFQLEQVYQGLALQLVVYLQAAMDLEKKKHPHTIIVPAGIYYYGIQDPLLEIGDEEVTDEDLKEELLKKLSMSGLTNSSGDVLKKTDQCLKGTTDAKSKVIPVELKKDGTLNARSKAHVASTKQFEYLGKHVREKIDEYCSEILSGRTETNPYQLGTKTGCDYCMYGELCGFAAHKSQKYRKLTSMEQTDEIWEKLDDMYSDKTQNNKQTEDGHEKEEPNEVE